MAAKNFKAISSRVIYCLQIFYRRSVHGTGENYMVALLEEKSYRRSKYGTRRPRTGNPQDSFQQLPGDHSLQNY
jgi:hypothetical protein